MSPVDRIGACARISLLRAIGFATLAIGTTVTALSWDPPLALMTGAALTAMTAAVLFYKGATAPTRDYRRTEVWIMLDKQHGLAEDRAQQIIGGVLGALYRRYGGYALAVAVVLWLLSILARLA